LGIKATNSLDASAWGDSVAMATARNAVVFMVGRPKAR
jgi:hypothetical protein